MIIAWHKKASLEVFKETKPPRSLNKNELGCKSLLHAGIKFKGRVLAISLREMHKSNSKIMPLNSASTCLRERGP